MVRKNALYNVAGSIVPLIVTFTTLPLYLAAIGEERYGILAIVWMLLGYFGLFDAGLGRATSNQIARLSGATPESRAAVFWTALGLNLAMGVLGASVLWLVGDLLIGRFVLAPDPLKREALSALYWIVLAVPVTTVAAVLRGGLQGRERFLAMNGVRTFDQALGQLVPLLVAYTWGAELGGLIASVVGVRLASALASFMLCARYVPLGGRPRFAPERVRQLLSYGGWVTVSSIVSPLLATLDRFVIGALAGAQAVTYYAVPYSLAYRITVIPGSLASAIFPRFSAQNDAERQALMTQAVRAVLVIVTPIVVVGVLSMRPFLAWWVTPEFAVHAALPGEIIALGLWFNSLALIAYTRLQAQGQPDVVAKFHLLELAPYLGCLWLAVSAWGIVGAAAVWSTRVAVDAALLFWATQTRSDMWVCVVTPAPLLACGFALAHLLPVSGIGSWVASLVLVVATLSWSWKSAPSSLKSRLWSRGSDAGIVRLQKGKSTQ